MSEKHSRIFGYTRDPDFDEKSEIEMLVETCPVALFQALNKKLNTKGYCLSIALFDENS